MMRRAVLFIIAAGAVAALFFDPLVERITNLLENQSAYLSALVAVAALGTAIAALSLAAWAIRNAYNLRSDIAQLSRSLDGALHKIDERSSQNAKTISEINSALKAEITSLTARPGPEISNDNGDRESASAVAVQDNDNVIPHPSVHKKPAPEKPIVKSADQPATSSGNRREIETAIAKVSGKEGPELSLQPIVSISKGEAKGFEVFAHLRLPGERFVDVQRLVSATGRMNVAGFERGLVHASAKAARQQLGSDAEKMPLHSAISTALLDDPEELSVVADLFDMHPALARSLVLSVPASLFSTGKSGRLAMLETLSEVGIRFAVENWTGSASEAGILHTAGARYVKQPAKRLLGLAKYRGNLLDAHELVTAVADVGLQIVATDVTTDEEAVGLIDSGIDLLTGTRFGDPRRLRDPASSASEKVARN